MVTTDLTGRSDRFADRFHHAVAVIVARTAALWRLAEKRRRRVTRLCDWNEHMLRDIGLTRGRSGSPSHRPGGPVPPQYCGPARFAFGQTRDDPRGGGRP
jgi:uncharacterized protein YjiS (DUF1127 family)